MPPIRKRRAPSRADREEDEEADVVPEPPRRRPRAQSDDDDADADNADDIDDNFEGMGDENVSQQQMVKALVRLALASEHTRTPIRRSDISAKVLNGRSRQFRDVFGAAQLALRSTFGMDLVELPAKEKITITQRRAAQKAASQGTQSNSSNKSWILVSILPTGYRDTSIVPPSRTLDEEMEASYTGLYSLTVALIALYGAPMPEARLERAFARMNASETTPVDRFDKLLERMAKQGYIVKIKDTSGGEETVEYVVGPRGKREVGSDGVAGLVRKVFGHSDDGTQAADELEKKLERSLKVASLDVVEESTGGAAAAAATANGNGRRTRRGRPPRNRSRDGMDEDDEEYDD